MRSYFLIRDEQNKKYFIGYRDSDDDLNDIFIDNEIPAFDNVYRAIQIVSSLNLQERKRRAEKVINLANPQKKTKH